MHHSKILFALLLALSTTIAIADEDIEKMLNEQQRELQADIEHSLVSPCCWNMTVDQHESGTSRQIRKEIAQLIKNGKNKEEILHYFVTVLDDKFQPKYGERILATPSQDNWLGKTAYWLIPVALILGSVVVIVVLRRLVKPEKPPVVSKKIKNVKKQENVDFFAQRVEEELNEYEN